MVRVGWERIVIVGAVSNISALVHFFLFVGGKHRGGASTSGAEHIRVAIILWVPSTLGWRSLSEAEHL